MNRSDASLRSTFLSVEGVAYACFLLLDLTGHGDLAFSLLGTDRLVPVALALTAGADWFLLVRNDRYLLGIALFLAVQAVYFLRLRRAGADRAWPLRSALALGAGLGVYALGMASAVNLAAALYFSQLAANALSAWTLGLTLFVGCDVCVGLFNVLPPGSAPYFAVSVGMWLFYLPSQVLIALSAFPGKENVK